MSHECGRHLRGQKCHGTWHMYGQNTLSLFQPLLAPASLLAPHLAAHPSICSQHPTSFPRSQSHFLMVSASPWCLPHEPATAQLQVFLPVFPWPVWSQFLVGWCSTQTQILVPGDTDGLHKKNNWGLTSMGKHWFFKFHWVLLGLYHAQWLLLVFYLFNAAPVPHLHQDFSSLDRSIKYILSLISVCMVAVLGQSDLRRAPKSPTGKLNLHC